MLRNGVGRRLAIGAVLSLALLAGLRAGVASALTLPPGFSDLPVATGLSGPTAIAWTPDGRLLVAEKAGRVRVVNATGTLLSEPLLDISDHVNSYIDRGLLGIEIDSEFAKNRYLYLFYAYESNPLDASGPKTLRITRVVVNDDNTVADADDPETVILGRVATGPCPPPSNTVDCLPAETGTHAVGGIRSDADGSLWIGIGDGANPAFVDPRAFRVLDESSFSGKVLHVDRAGRGLPGHPFCPGEADLDLVCTKLYAKGFRYPFKLALRTGAAPLAADVGWNSREELDVVRAGRSYGWPCYEGVIRTPGFSDTAACAGEYAKEGSPAAALGPVYDYGHDGRNSAIIGGPVYTGQAYPAEYRGSYFFGDSSRRFIRRLTLDGDVVTSATEFATDWIEGPDLEQSPAGDLVYVDFGFGSPGRGSVRRIGYQEEPPSENKPPVVRASVGPLSDGPPFEFSYQSSESFDPDGDPLRFRWTFGDGHGNSQPNGVHRYQQPGTYVARVVVSDDRGGTSSTEFTMRAGGDESPIASISEPKPDRSYRGGETIELEGSGRGGDGAELPASALSWQVILHHGDHVHDFGTLEGAKASFTVERDHDSDSYFEIILTATDPDGGSDTDTVEIRPRTVRLGIESVPAGAPLSYAGTAVTAPYSRESAVGFRTTISAAEEFSSGGRTFRFESWSDGGDRLHEVTIPDEDLSLTARYVELEPPPQGNRPPAASFTVSPASPIAGQPVSFTSTSSDPDGELVLQAWDLDDDGHFQNASGPTASRTFDTPGTYTVRLYVRDDEAAESIATRTITVVGGEPPPPPQNQPPQASFDYEPAAPAAGETVRLRSTSADPDGSILVMAWDLDGDGHFQNARGAEATTSFANPGDHTVSLYVQDQQGAFDIATRTITVGNASAFSTRRILSHDPTAALLGTAGEGTSSMAQKAARAAAKDRRATLRALTVALSAARALRR
jgi:glucose/arabinose dehydrogenase/PKD repeat protein